jgi:hypothetical protein
LDYQPAEISVQYSVIPRRETIYINVSSNSRIEGSAWHYVGVDRGITGVVGGTSADVIAARSLYIEDVLSDSAVTKDEKINIRDVMWPVIFEEKPTLVAKAASLSISSANYQIAYNTLHTELFVTVNHHMIPDSLDLTIPRHNVNGTLLDSAYIEYTTHLTRGNRLDLSSAVSGYNTELTKLNAAITAKALNDSSTANTTATLAQSVANSAQAVADSANLAVSDMTSDGILSPTEKLSLRAEWDALVAEKVSIDAQATTFGIITEKTAYNNALIDLGSYLSINPWSSGIPYHISDARLSISTPIIGATFRTKNSTLYQTRAALLSKLAAVAGTKADWSSVNSRPTSISGINSAEGSKLSGIEAGATVGATSTQATKLNGIADGANQTFISGGGLYGVSSGAGTAVANTSITLTSGGILSGGGGGQITNLDYGYVGGTKPPSNATYGADINSLATNAVSTIKIVAGAVTSGGFLSNTNQISAVAWQYVSLGTVYVDLSNSSFVTLDIDLMFALSGSGSSFVQIYLATSIPAWSASFVTNVTVQHSGTPCKKRLVASSVGLSGNYSITAYLYATANPSGFAYTTSTDILTQAFKR